MGHGIRKPTHNKIFRQTKFCWRDAINPERINYLLRLIPRVRNIEKEANEWTEKYLLYLNEERGYHFYEYRIPLDQFIFQLEKEKYNKQNIKILSILDNKFIRKN